MNFLESDTCQARLSGYLKSDSPSLQQEQTWNNSKHHYKVDSLAYQGNGCGGGTFSPSTSRLERSLKNFISKQCLTCSAILREPVILNVAGRSSFMMEINFSHSSSGTKPCSYKRIMSLHHNDITCVGLAQAHHNDVKLRLTHYNLPYNISLVIHSL